MNKIITKPAECGCRVPSGLSQCNHYSRRNKDCSNPLIFPSNCPLPDGIVKPVITTTDLLEIDEAKDIQKNVPWQCTMCITSDTEYCLNVCPIKR